MLNFLNLKRILIFLLVPLLLFVVYLLFSFFSKDIIYAPTIEKKETLLDQKIKKTSSVKMVFAGDMMFGRLVGHRHQSDNFVRLLENFNTNILKDSDIAWANLEGPISNTIEKQDLSSSDLSFLFSKETIEALKELKLDIVGLANNHTIDKGTNFFNETQNLLKNAGVIWHGHPTRVDQSSVYRFEKDNFKISLIAVHNLYSNSDLGINKLISSEKSGENFVIVLPHWGEEYKTKHSLGQQNYAKTWINSGADLIIGTHPHVVQDAEIFEKKNGKKALVIYSLGNFIFDQIFSDETQIGLIVEVVLNNTNQVIKLIPIESVNLKPQLADGEIKSKIINRICENIMQYCNKEKGEIEISGLTDTEYK